MEISSTTGVSKNLPSHKLSRGILLLPVIFGITVWALGHFAYNQGLFYMPPAIIKISALILFPLTWIYLALRKIGPRVSTVFALIAGSVLLMNLFLHTANETSKYQSILNISKNFSLPEGWVEAGEASSYQFLGELWKKNDEGNPLTEEGLKKIATDNNIKNYRIMGTCNPSPPYLGCGLYGGDIDGQKVELKYFDSTYEGDKSTLTLFIRENAPPRGYRLIPHCGGMDAIGDMYVSRPCSPVEIAKSIILP